MKLTQSTRNLLQQKIHVQNNEYRNELIKKRDIKNLKPAEKLFKEYSKLAKQLDKITKAKDNLSSKIRNLCYSAQYNRDGTLILQRTGSTTLKEQIKIHDYNSKNQNKYNNFILELEFMDNKEALAMIKAFLKNE